MRAAVSGNTCSCSSVATSVTKLPAMETATSRVGVSSGGGFRAALKSNSGFALPTRAFSRVQGSSLAFIISINSWPAVRTASQSPAGTLRSISAASASASDIEALAAAGALAQLSGHRRRALWDVSGIERMPPLLVEAPIGDAVPVLTPPDEGDNIIADYASLGLTLGRHPLALLRHRLQRQRMLTAAELHALPHGRVTRVTGLVTGRQRPGTASGVTFVTLEDETGMINVIVWRDLAEKQRKELLRANLLTVYGTLEREGEVVHLIAARLHDQTALLGKLATRSRDFH